MNTDGPGHGSPVVEAVRPGWVRRAIASLVLLASAPASLAYEPPERPPFQFENVAPERGESRSWVYEVGLRGRMLSIPASILAGRYFDATAENWAYIEDRPAVTGRALGLEVVVRGTRANGIFYGEYVDSTMRGGYWDKIEEPPDHLNGEYLEPSTAFGIAVLGADYAHELPLVKPELTKGAFGLSFLVGGGLGVGIVTGRIDRWLPDDEGNPAYKRFLDGELADDPARIPPVVPIVDATGALRLTLGERASIRLEGGLHTVLFYGISAGVVF
ncbi:MAG: hypothetical protein ACI8PZ_005330 [Myxococcota bacterium]|jgi:hypothetical protein